MQKVRESSNTEGDTTASSAPPKKKSKTKDTPVDDTEFQLSAGSQDSEVPSTAPPSAFSGVLQPFFGAKSLKAPAGKRKKKKKSAEEEPTSPNVSRLSVYLKLAVLISIRM
jgi:hypothetical protein